MQEGRKSPLILSETEYTTNYYLLTPQKRNHKHSETHNRKAQKSVWVLTNCASLNNSEDAFKSEGTTLICCAVGDSGLEYTVDCFDSAHW